MSTQQFTRIIHNNSKNITITCLHFLKMFLIHRFNEAAASSSHQTNKLKSKIK
ncbi:unnamed protein product [Meloidogyne enterolobii]|uniref:Uncharacterized protein n=1 Tax=Meloidogyne enterolobii TaxID=390850 RepID=A0ACB0Y4Z3_MELEN